MGSRGRAQDMTGLDQEQQEPGCVVAKTNVLFATQPELVPCWGFSGSLLRPGALDSSDMAHPLSINDNGFDLWSTYWEAGV